MVNDENRPPGLLSSVPTVHPAEFLRLTGLTRAELDVLLSEGLIEGGYGAAGELRAIFLDPLPPMERMQALGMAPHPGYAEALRAANTEVVGSEALDEGGVWDGPRGTMGWT